MPEGGTIWITGIPASGKSTVAGLVSERIRSRNGRAEILDGDAIRSSISRGLGFTKEDRAENVRRIAWTARLLARNGVWAVVAAVSPYKKDREEARKDAEAEIRPFFEVHTKCSVEAAEARDRKGLYAKARAGGIRGFTGVDDPYEAPEKPHVLLDTASESAEACADKVVKAALWRPQENPPVICFGRGAGGTRFASMLVQDVGVFVGTHATINGCDDSMDWVPLIYRMLEETSGKPALPEGSCYRNEILETARKVLLAAPIPPGAPWGWKLPETTLVLPFFADAFPSAKFIHVVRHPVSACLRKSHVTSSMECDIGKASLPGAYAYCGRNYSFAASDETWLRNAFSWQHQVTRAVCYGRARLDPKNYLEMRFEDIRNDPEVAFRTVERFLGLARVRRHTSVLYDPKRVAPTSPNDPRADKVWQICERTAAMLGYTRNEI